MYRKRGNHIWVQDFDGNWERDYEAEEKQREWDALSEDEREEQREMKAIWDYYNSDEYMREQFGDDLENYDYGDD